MKKWKKIKNWLCHKGKFGFVTKPNFGARPTGHGGQNWLCYKAKNLYNFFYKKLYKY